MRSARIISYLGKKCKNLYSCNIVNCHSKMGIRSEIGVLVTTKRKGFVMKKLALTSLLAVFAISSANAATNYFVGGSTALAFTDGHKNVASVAPEFGWKVNSKWDLGIMGDFEYVRDSKDDAYEYGVGVFTRYHAAKFGDVELLFKGGVEADFVSFDGHTGTELNAAIIPMITYDVSESFTLYANLDFLGVYAGYAWKNEKVGLERGWGFGANADSDKVMNTKDFQIGFNYNF